MRFICRPLALLGGLFGLFSLAMAGRLAAADSAPATKSKRPEVTLTFFLSGVECPSCVYSVWQSLQGIKGISDVNAQQRLDSFANVTFDPELVSAHRIAQAVSEAWPLHGKPYLASLTLQVPDYGKGGNAAKADAVFAAQKPWVKIDLLDKARGEFSVAIELAKPAADEKPAKSWRPDDLLRALRTPPPDGPGLACSFVEGK